MSSTHASLLNERLDDSKNTARSILVTVFGDTVLPCRTELWLAQLFKLTETFGFSERLARTSMFRLAAEGWLTNERVGRQSRYTLTPLAIEESRRASARIYTPTPGDWKGSWTVAFLGSLAAEERDRVGRHLRWHGFIRLSSGVLASPNVTIENAAEICQLIESISRVPLGVLEFADLDQVVADGFFDSGLGIGAMSDAYRGFIDTYQALQDAGQSWTPSQAFALRTVLVQDLRRIRLSGPDIPSALLPADWSGGDAYALATHLYPRLSAAARPWLSDVLEVAYPTSFPQRFPPHSQ